jgi:hypothetical protein
MKVHLEIKQRTGTINPDTKLHVKIIIRKQLINISNVSQSYVHKREKITKKLTAVEIREDWTFTICFPSQRKMLKWVLKKQAKCLRDRLAFYLLWVGQSAALVGFMALK